MYKVFQVLMTGYEARWGGILFKRDSRPTHIRAGNSGVNMQEGYVIPVPPHFDSGKISLAARTSGAGMSALRSCGRVLAYTPFK
jgi:hypothetical protein